MNNLEYQVERDIWPESVPRKLEFPHGKRPIHEHIGIHAQERPNDPALTFYRQTLTWAEVDEEVDSFSHALNERGYEKGDVCALHLQNCPQFFIAYHGAHRAGMIVTLLNPQYKPSALRYQLQDNNASIIVTHSGLADTIYKIKGDTSIDDIVVVQYKNYTNPSSSIPMHSVVENEPSIPYNLISFSQFMENVSDNISLPDVTVDDLALLNYTGGTTGLPKGCKHTHWNILFTSAATTTMWQYQPEEVHLGVMPIFHIAGKLYYLDSNVMAGLHTVLLPRYTPEEMMETIDEHKVTLSWFTVPIAYEIATHEKVDKYDLTSMSKYREQTFVASLGTKLTQEISNAWEKVTGASLQETSYGLTETHTNDTITVDEFDIDPEKGTFCGQPNYGEEIEIRDFETNESLKPEEEGEIVVRTPSIMEGYLNRPEATEEVLEPDGFLHTGDIGRMTEKGYLYFLGRQKDVIKVSGHTVAPREVESILENDDRIKDAVVTGRPHETRGHVLEAHVIPSEKDVTENDIINLTNEKLAEFKQPKSIIFIDSFPRTDIGKVDRVAYRKNLPEGYE